MIYPPKAYEEGFYTNTDTSSGALCGAVFLDDEFKALLNRKIEEVSPGARGRLASEELQNIMTDDWEKIRNQFQGEKKVWTIRHPYSLLGLNGPQDLRNGWPKFEVTTSELKEVFDPVVQRIKALVHGQVDAVLAKEDQDPKVCPTCPATFLILLSLNFSTSF